MILISLSPREERPSNANPLSTQRCFGLREKVNWDDFPNTVPMDTSAEQDSGSQVPEANPPQEELAMVVAIAGGYSSLVSYSTSSIKRGCIEAMDTEEVDTTSTPKRQKIESG